MSKADRINHLLSFGVYPYGEVARRANATQGYVSYIVNTRPGATALEAINDKKTHRNEQHYYLHRQHGKALAKARYGS